MKVKRKIIKIDEEKCDGCGQCVPGCAEGALQIVDGKAKMISENLCDGLGACLGECPNDALEIIEREAEEFDEAAVEKHLSERETEAEATPMKIIGGCPSAKIQTFANQKSSEMKKSSDQSDSALTHWPVQIRLVPPTAPFLKGADLLVLADCVPVAFSSLHQSFMQGKAVTMGCPKFDDVQDYIHKFGEIFKIAGIKSITSIIMEVPCCAGLPMIVKKGMEIAGVQVPMTEVVISTRGEILEERMIA